MQKFNAVKYIHLLLLLCNIVFITLYCILLFFNRYAADDYFFVYNANARGVIGAASYTAHTWTPRPSEMIIYNTLTKYFSERAVLIGYGFVVFGLLVMAIYKLFQMLVKKLHYKPSFFILFNYSLLFSISFFFCCVSIGETWFWLCSSLGYLMSLVAFLWAIFFLLNNKNHFITYAILLICFGYVIGAAETFAAFSLFICWLWLAIIIYKNGAGLTQLIQNPIFKKLIFVTTISSISFILIFFSVGTQFRKSILTQAPFFTMLFISGKTMAYLFIKKLSLKLTYLILFSIPFLWIGKQLALNVSTEYIFNRKFLLKVVFSFLILTFISLMPACYIMSDRGPERSFTVNAFLCALLFMYLLSYAGYKTQHSKINYIVNTGLFINLFFLIYTSAEQFTLSKSYSKAIDNRIKYVTAENEKGRTNMLELEPLPSSGFYYSTELSNDTSIYTNTFFKQRFNLNFSCRVKRE